MIVLTYSTGFVILDKELKPMVMLASSAGSLVLKKSEAAGDGGFLCYFLRSGRVKSGSTPLSVSRFLTVTRLLCWFRLLSAFSLPAHSLCLSLLYTLFFSFCLVAFSLFSLSVPFFPPVFSSYPLSFLPSPVQYILWLL